MKFVDLLTSSVMDVLLDCKLNKSCGTGDGRLVLSQMSEILRLMIIQKDTGWAKPDPELVDALGFRKKMAFYLKDK